MTTNDMQDMNRRAIVALDAGDISHAERLFARNYHANPCLMTALNYANFLGDCHHLAHQGIAAEFVQHQRLARSRKLLARCMADTTADSLTRAHMLCLMGDHEYDARHFPQARECFRKAVVLSDGDPTIRLKTTFMLAWLAALADEAEEAAKLLDSLGEMLELTDDFLDAFARLDDYSPLSRFPYYPLCVWAYAHSGRGAEAEALLARMYAASFAREIPAFADDDLIACRQDCHVFDPEIHHLTRNACHFIGCPVHGEQAE